MTQPVASPGSVTHPLAPPSPATRGAAAVERPEAPDRPGGRRGGRRTKVLLGILLAALLVLPSVGAAVWSSMQPPTYAAEADLLHEPSDTSATDTIDRQLATHQVLLLRRDLLEEAATSVGRDPADLAENVAVEAVEGSSLIRIQVVDRDSERADRTAAFIAERYVDVAGPLAGSSNIGLVQLVDPPTVLPEPVGPQPLRAAAAGALLGLVLVLAFLALLRLRGTDSRRSGR